MGVPRFSPGAARPLPEELVAIAGLETVGFVRRIGPQSYEARAIQIDDVNGLTDVLDQIQALPDPSGLPGGYLRASDTGTEYELAEPDELPDPASLPGGLLRAQATGLGYELTATITTAAIAGLDAILGGLADTLANHAHAGLSTTIAAGSLWAGQGTGVPVAVPIGVGSADSVLRRSDGDGRYALASHSHTFTSQVLITQSGDTYHYPYVNMRRSRGTPSSLMPVVAGDYIGGLNAYGYLNGAYNFVGSVLYSVVETAPTGPVGQVVFAVNNGSDPNNSTQVITATAATVSLRKPTTVQGDLTVTGSVAATGPLPAAAWTTAGAYHGTEAGTPRSVYTLGSGAARWLVDHNLDGSFRWVRETAPGTGEVHLSLLAGVRTYFRDRLEAAGGLKIGHLADATAPADTLYYSTDAGKLAYKDPSGTVHPLY